MNIELHIERLVLEGVELAPGQGRLLQAAVEAELVRLLGSGGIARPLVHGAALSRVNADAIQMTNEAGAAGLGTQIAASIYSGIGR
jgi:hypothetical protein